MYIVQIGKFVNFTLVLRIKNQQDYFCTVFVQNCNTQENKSCLLPQLKCSFAPKSTDLGIK